MSSGFSFMNTTAAPTFGTGSITFGTPATQPPQQFGFGTQPTQPTAAPSLFGTPTPAATSALGFKPTGFGAPTTTQSTGFSFGTAAPSFGAPVSSAPATGFSFGTPAATAVAAPSTGLTFGAPAATTTSGLGLKPATDLTFGTPAPTNLGFGTPASTGLSFGTPAAGTTLGTAGATGLFGMTTAAPTLGTGLSFGTPVASTTGLSFGTATTSVAGFGLGTTTTLPNLKLGFGTTTATPGLGLAPTTTTSAPTLGLGFGAVSTAAAAPTLGLSFNTATTSAPSFSFGGAATTSSGFSFGTATPSLGLGLGGTTTSTSGLGLSTATTSQQTVGLGGVAFTQTKAGSGASTQKELPPKEQLLPNEFSQLVEQFKNLVQEEKNKSSEVARCSVKEFCKVENELDSLNHQFNQVENQLLNHHNLAEQLKYDTAKGLQNIEMAQRTQDTPPSLQYENSAPLQFFLELADNFEREMQVLKMKIDNTEKFVKKCNEPNVLTSQDLALGLKRLHETFIALSGRMQSIHSQVETQKESFLQLRRQALKDNTNPFEKTDKNIEAMNVILKNALKTAPPTLASGPTPFNSIALSSNNMALAAQAQATPFQIANTTTSSLGFGLGSTPAFGTASNTSMFKPTGFGSSPFQLNTSSNFQLQKPPTGNKRGKQ